MGSDVEVQDPPASVLDDEKAVQQFECHGWHGEEVEGSDYLAMVLEKAQPTLARVAPATNSPKIPGHTSFRDDEAELLQFSVDLGAPQSGFSSARRRIRPRISSVIFGLPPRGRERHRQ